MSIERKNNGDVPPSAAHVLTTKQVLVRLQISDTTLRRYIKRGFLVPVYFSSRARRFHLGDIERMEKEGLFEKHAKKEIL
jgi:predicted site-specific integrase-resolvase